MIRCNQQFSEEWGNFVKESCFMKFNLKIALVCFLPYVPLIVLYFLVHLYISNKVIALLVGVGIFSILYILVHYQYAKPFFKRHPELDPHNLELTTMANIVVGLGFVALVGLTLTGMYWDNPAVILLSFVLYYSVVNGFKSYRGTTK